MRHTKKKKVVYSLLVAAILLAVVILAWPAKKLDRSGQSGGGQSNSLKSSSQKPQPFNKNQYPLDVADSLWAVVNKGRALPADYTPPDLTVPQMHLRYSASRPEMHVRAVAAVALGKMFDDARSASIELMLTSGYRSYSYQVSVYGNYVKTDGTAKADTYSARPGHSEHQTGLAADLEPYSENCELDQCFGSTPEGRWLAANCYKYGFIIRYPKGKDDITGYEYEPWHVRYVGIGLASQLHSTGQTLEQYFGLPNYPDYPAKSLTLKL
jgi:D-alanyl-D-alanine carboxypeptidase